jgi:hypothetical protein
VGKESAGLDDGGVAFGTGGDHADFELEQIGDEAKVVDGVLGELAGVFGAVGIGTPTGKGLVDGRYSLILFRRSGHFMDRRALVGIPRADADFALRVEDVELGDGERVDAVDHFGVDGQ